MAFFGAAAGAGSAGAALTAACLGVEDFTTFRGGLHAEVLVHQLVHLLLVVLGHVAELADSTSGPHRFFIVVRLDFPFESVDYVAH